MNNISRTCWKYVQKQYSRDMNAQKPGAVSTLNRLGVHLRGGDNA